MKIDKHVILRAKISSLIDKVGHNLIITIHKVHLEAFHTHISKVLHHILHIACEGIVTSPQHDTYIASLAIIH